MDNATGKIIRRVMIINIVSTLLIMLIYVIICDLNFNVAMSQRFKNELLFASSALIMNIVAIAISQMLLKHLNSQIIFLQHFKSAKGDDNGYHKI
ncbi:MAG: hypothetical protein K2Q03_00910 [Sphingobacteriaceae bacterium]|nr:hypothetical protein [Sphingobacteriaceae bacterium]